MDAEPQEIRKMFDSVALRAGLDQHVLFEWCRLCLYRAPNLVLSEQVQSIQEANYLQNHGQ